LYQPKIDLQTTAWWAPRRPHPIFGLVGPQQFLPLVRQHGLMRTQAGYRMRSANVVKEMN
jgi:hypothetical protein